MKTDRMQNPSNITTMTPKGAKNGAGFRPIGTKVIVLPDEVGETTKGGILLTEKTQDNESFAVVKGVLVAVGGAAFSDWPNSRDPWPGSVPKEGDRVVMAKYAGFVIDGNDGKKYRWMQDTDICGFEN